MSMKAL